MRLGCEWRHARKRWAGILDDFEKKAVSWDLTLDEASWFLSRARPVQLELQDTPHVVGSDGIVGIIKIVSPRVEKVSYLNQESRQCFAYFGISMDLAML